jgi:hypothetical protein
MEKPCEKLGEGVRAGLNLLWCRCRGVREVGEGVVSTTAGQQDFNEAKDLGSMRFCLVRWVWKVRVNFTAGYLLEVSPLSF